MNKYLAKGIASALLITTVAGGMALAPINQDAEAATTKYTQKLCTHTNITTSIEFRSAKAPYNTKDTYSGGVTVQTVGKYRSKTYNHNHSYGYAFTTDYKTCKNTHSIAIRKQGTDTKVSIVGTSPYKKVKGKYVANAFYNRTIQTKKSSARNWGKATTKNHISGYYKCSECKLTHNSAAGTMTVRCPLCSKSVTIAPKTAKITVKK